MNLFISWSGELSGQIAGAFRDWVPSVLQYVEPYYTPGDIDKGARWNTDMSEKLSESNLGVLFLTPDNLHSDWILFEAGALSKALQDDAKVCPVRCAGVTEAEIPPPLKQFQASDFGREDIYKLLTSINNSAEKPVAKEVLDRAFDGLWPDFEKEVGDLVEAHDAADKPEKKTTEQLLNDLFSLQTSMGHKISLIDQKPRAASAMVNAFLDVHSRVHSRDEHSVIMDGLKVLRAPLYHMWKLGRVEDEETDKIERVLREIPFEVTKDPGDDDDFPF